MVLAPIGTLGAIANTIGRYGLGSLVQLAQLTIEVLAVSALFVLVVLGGILELMRYLREGSRSPWGPLRRKRC